MSTYLPQGAYVELPQLQKLRYFAPALPTHKSLAQVQALGGKHRSRALNRGMEFEEVRLYQSGDDIRTIDWRVTARTQVAHTKCYREEKEKPVITLVDQRRSLFFGSDHCFKSVYACHLAALINWSSLKGDDRAGGMVLGTDTIEETRPVRSHRAVNRWLQQLTRANNALNIDRYQDEPSFFSSLKQLHNTLSHGCEIAIISDFYDLDTACEQRLCQLSKHHRLTLYWIVDPLEQALPNLETLAFSNGDKSHSVSINRAVRAQHQQAYHNKHERLKALCQSFTMSFIKVNTQQTPSLYLTPGQAGRGRHKSHG
ncbi:MAG: DUF58 domain-containing protein [Cellvibrionaceae bacterium]|nr:DUF58 domain-containing protein [Cellvibrionaceae bacterium]